MQQQIRNHNKTNNQQHIWKYDSKTKNTSENQKTEQNQKHNIRTKNHSTFENMTANSETH